MCSNENNHNSFAKGAILGAMIGAAAGVLFAPKPGKETRKELKEKYEQVADTAQEKVELVKEKLDPIISELEYRLTPLLERIDDETADAREEAKEKITAVIDELESRIDKGKHSIKKKMFKK